ncbi:BTB/POZ protein [Rhizophagus clarus]|uniref:BTB/POZ protein n=1 Tax=Rhizophagus clarus TaxID=94130 RepID=A0A8H3LQG2_9GLOM|nr:BTB/POZ protein [Rhizophagus clarus]
MSILILLSKLKNNNITLVHIKFPNITPGIFQIILKYIYGGIISLNEQEPLEALEVLAAADQLYFQEIIFDSLDFTLLTEKSLISLIKRDDLQMKEIDIWENVLKWGLEKNPTLLSDSTTWSNDDFKMMENTLQHCLPLVRFFSLSSEDFFQKVRPYKKLLKHSLYEELLESYLNPNSIPSDNILLPRYKNIDEIIDSTIVNLNIVSLISRWIDKIDIKSKFAYTRELYLPFKDPILSHVIDTEYALYYDNNHGPTFDGDIDIYSSIGVNSEYDHCSCSQGGYEKKLRDTYDLFSIEDYEVFQIIKKKK